MTPRKPIAERGEESISAEWIEAARAALARSGNDLREAEPEIARAIRDAYERGLRDGREA